MNKPKDITKPFPLTMVSKICRKRLYSLRSKGRSVD
jgi:hypothetical protein